ncbi:uncharacterized protein [Littorina saxatilis]|uniref:Apple domain-containing protein n=1 Tax=Littorina saxatilis TaxID=31220 RepID=A0AAN9AZD0_9CAEN
MPASSSLFLVFLFFATSFAEANVRHFVSKTNETLDGSFVNNVLWSSNIRTVRECAVLCAADRRCSSFTLLRNASETCQSCLGISDDEAVGNQAEVSVIRAAVFHQVSVRDSADFTTTPETATWAGQTCDIHSDCSQLQANTSCFLRTCVCTPGFFYSISSDTCVSECPSGKLAQSYMKYENHSLPGQNDMQLARSLQECFDLCNANPTCLSIDFNKPTTQNCYISYSMATGPNQLRSDAGGNLDYYQRQCE